MNKTELTNKTKTNKLLVRGLSGVLLATILISSGNVELGVNKGQDYIKAITHTQELTHTKDKEVLALSTTEATTNKEVYFEDVEVKVSKGQDLKQGLNIKNMDYDIYYYKGTGSDKVKKYAVKNATTDKNGKLKQLKTVIPKDVSYVYVNYKPSNNKVGKIVNVLGNRYNLIYPIKVGNAKTNNIKVKETFNFSQKDEEFSVFLYDLVNAFNIYNEIYEKQNEDNIIAKKELTKKGIRTKYSSYKTPPVNLMYDTRYIKGGGLFTKVGSNALGELKPEERYIKVSYRTEGFNGDKSYTQNKATEHLWVNISHEWQHALMYHSGAKMLGGAYETHESFNTNLNTVYKEGWALFQANRTTWGYNHNVRLDYDVQKTKRDILYGKPTNRTAMAVLRDIYDFTGKHEPEEVYDIGLDVSPNFDNENPNIPREKLASGLMYISMYDSKAHTLKEYLNYLEHKSGMVKDKKKFKTVLTTNGLDKDYNYINYDKNKQY